MDEDEDMDDSPSTPSQGSHKRKAPDSHGGRPSKAPPEGVWQPHFLPAAMRAERVCVFNVCTVTRLPCRIAVYVFCFAYCPPLPPPLFHPFTHTHTHIAVIQVTHLTS